MILIAEITMTRIKLTNPEQVPAGSKTSLASPPPCHESEAAYSRLVVCARASERITPEGLEQVYAMSISVSDAEIDRLVAAGELEPGTLRPLRSGFAMEPSRKQAVKA